MSINPVNNNENRNFSVPKAAIGGAMLGYAATFAIPLTTEEHTHYFTKTVKDKINQKVISARKNEIQTIVEELNNEGIKPLVRDVFQKNKAILEKEPGRVLEELHNCTRMDKALKKTLKNMYKRVNNTGKLTETIENAAHSLAAKKDSRVPLYYALIAGFAMAGFAILKNAIYTFMPKNQPVVEEDEYEMTNFDYIINCAEGPAELYIFTRHHNQEQ